MGIKPKNLDKLINLQTEYSELMEYFEKWEDLAMFLKYNFTVSATGTEEEKKEEIKKFDSAIELIEQSLMKSITEQQDQANKLLKG